MTKMTKAKKQRKGYETPPRDRLTAIELSELQAIHQMAVAKRIEADLVLKNTALIEDGQKFGNQLDMLAKFIEQYKTNWLAQKFTEMGYEPGTHLKVDSLGNVMKA